jgi:phosphoglycerate dehydrogenase-like enzyme
MKLLHLAGKEPHANIWTPLFVDKLRAFGEVRVERDTNEWSDQRVVALARQHEIVITNWGSRRLPEALADDPGCLKYICNLTGEIRPYIPRVFIEKQIAVTNWGEAPAHGVAEGALTLLLAVLKEIIPQRELIKSGGWNEDRFNRRGSVRDLRLGILGLGAIGKAFAELVRPLQPRLHGFDPYARDWPDGVRRMDSLEALFSDIDAVVITAARTQETIRCVSRELLARLPDGGIVINVSRGALIDQDALFDELERGRLRAGLDVLDTNGADSVDTGHPCRQWPNLILTGHHISGDRWNMSRYAQGHLSRIQDIGLDNIRRFVTNKPLRYSFDPTRYDRST